MSIKPLSKVFQHVLDSTSARAHSLSRTTRTTITYHETTTITTTLHRCPSQYRWWVAHGQGQHGGGTVNLAPFLLVQWLRATVSVYYISEVGLLTIIWIPATDSTYFSTRVDTHSGDWAPSATGGGKAMASLHESRHRGG